MSRRSHRRIGLLSAALGVLLGATPILAQETADDAAVLRSYYSGNGFLNRGMHELAAEEYRKFLAAHDGHEKAPVARYGLAVSLFRLKQFTEALDELVRLRDAGGFPYAAEVLMIDGQCRVALSRYAEAVDSFGRLLAVFPDHDLADDALAIQAEAMYRDGRYGDVAAPVDVLLERWPDSPRRERAELYRGLADMALDRHRDAAARFEAMTRRFPQGAHAGQTALLLAQSLHRSGAVQEAATQYREVIDRGERDFAPDALYGMALLQHQQGRLEEAGTYLDELLVAYGDDAIVPDARLLRGRVWYELSDFDMAVEQFRVVAGQDGPLRDDATYWLAKCDLRRDDAAAAAERLTEARERFADSELLPQITYDRAVALLRAGAVDTAVDALSAFREQFPAHALAADAQQLMAITEHDRGSYDRSLELCRAFLAEHPMHPFSPLMMFLAAENEFLPQRYARAEAGYREFLEQYPLDPQAPKATYRLGMSLYHQDRLEEAEAVLAEVIDGEGTAEAFRPALLALGDGHFQREQWPQAEAHLADYLSFGLEQPAADDALLKLGLAQHRQERFEQAVASYDRLLEHFRESPHYTQAHFERGQALVSLDRHEEAAEAFSEVLDVGPDSRFAVHALNHLGSISMGGSAYDEASDYFARAAAGHPHAASAAEALYQQGQALMAAESFDRAAEIFAKLVNTYGETARVPAAAALEAIALARHGQHEKALSKIEAVEGRYASDLKSDLVTAMAYEKAWCQRDLDRPEDAAATYRRLLEGGGDSDLHRFSMLEVAELDFEAERFEQASSWLERLRQAVDASDRPVDPELREQALYRLGVTRFNLGDLESAAELLESFITTYPQSPRMASASLFCGEALFKLGSHQQAVVHLTRVVQEHPDDDACPPSLLRLGEALAVLQDFEHSGRTFGDYLQRFAKEPLWYQAQFGVGWALDNQGRYDEAIDAYREVIDRHQGPTAARAQFQIGQCLFAQNQLEPAARELLKVDILYAYPEWSAAALYEAGRCFQEMANPVDARKQFEKVVEDFPETEWAKLAQERLNEMSSTSLPGQ